MSRRPLFAALAPIRRRQRWAFGLQALGWGLALSSLAAIGLGLARVWGASTSTATIWAVLASGPVLGLLVGLAWPQSWRSAAAAVDAHYDLKDRALTALAFLAKPERGAWNELQSADALEHLAIVEPRQVVPVRLPRSWPYATAALTAAVVLIVWPGAAPQVEAGPAEPSPVILAEAEQIQEDLQEFLEMLKQESNEDLEKLVEELQEKVEELKRPGVDTHEALAKLSEMQAALQAQQAQYNVAAVDAQLQSLGDALQTAESLQSAGKALSETKYEKAVEELEKIEEPQLQRKEAKTLEEKLQKVAKAAEDSGMGALSDAASAMSEGTKGNSQMFKQGTRSLAKETQKQARRRKINDLLCRECDRLSECKCNCQKNSLTKGKKPQKSTSPSNSFGLGESGNFAGDKTSLGDAQKFEQLTGQQGEGDSEIDTTHSVEGKQQASRGYREVYQKYRKLSESVLDSEQIPLGHRQTIRRYFELIRPDHADDAAAKSGEN